MTFCTSCFSLISLAIQIQFSEKHYMSVQNMILLRKMFCDSSPLETRVRKNNHKINSNFFALLLWRGLRMERDFANLFLLITQNSCLLPSERQWEHYVGPKKGVGYFLAFFCLKSKFPSLSEEISRNAPI